MNLCIENLKKAKEFKFVRALIGFENHIKFYFYEYKKGSPFIVMQSIDYENLSFILINIKDFFPDYSLILSEEDKKMINYDEKNIINLALVTIPKKVEDMTVNLLAPIVVNYKDLMLGQFINLNNKYSLREKLIKDK